VFRADLIEALESEVGWGAAVQAAAIMLSEASTDQIEEVRDLLPDDLKAVVSAGLQSEISQEIAEQREECVQA
jgi:hypothetical protein